MCLALMKVNLYRSEELSIEMMKSGNYRSHPRNLQIADVFKSANIIEKYGSGVKRVIKTFKEYGLVEPQFEATMGGVLVTVYKENLNSNNNEGVNEGVKSLLTLIKKHPNKKTPFFVKELSTSVKNIERWIKKLKDKEEIEFVGSSKTGGYFVK